MRTLIETERFSREKLAIEKNVARFDEILYAVTFALSRNIRIGKKTSNPRIWAVPTDPWNTRGVIIYYSFDDDHVYLEAILIEKDEQDFF